MLLQFYYICYPLFITLQLRKLLSYKIIGLLLINTMLCLVTFAQQASLDGTKLLYRNFKTNSATITSRGISYTFRKAKFVQGKDRLFEFDLATVKDAKQSKVKGQDLRFKSFYYGKLNSVMNIRLGIGWQKALYNKEVPKAIEIKNGFTFGATLGILKPVYVQVYAPIDKSDNKKIVSERYDVTKHNAYNILGRASFFNGISKTTINPGAFLKYYYTFNFSADDDRIKALECGLIADFYLKGLEIMANNTPKRFMVTLYASYTFGSKKL